MHDRKARFARPPFYYAAFGELFTIEQWQAVVARATSPCFDDENTGW